MSLYSFSHHKTASRSQFSILDVRLVNEIYHADIRTANGFSIVQVALLMTQIEFIGMRLVPRLTVGTI